MIQPTLYQHPQSAQRQPGCIITRIMIDKLKRQPLIGLALAIAAGYVLAHIITRALDIIYEDALGSDPASAAVWLIAIAFVACATWKKRAIGLWIKRHDHTLISTATLILGAFSLMGLRAGIIDARERKQSPVTLDLSRSIPIKNATPTYLDNNGNPIPTGAPLDSHGNPIRCPSKDDPVRYASLLDLQKRLRIPPSVANGNDPPECVSPESRK